MNNKLIILLIIFISNACCYAEQPDYQRELAGTWRVARKIDRDEDAHLMTSWGETGIKNLSRDLVIDISDDHPELTIVDGSNGKWHIYAHGIYTVKSIIMDDDIYKLVLNENWFDPNSSSIYWRGGRTGVVYIKQISENVFTLRIGDESDEYFNFLSLEPEYGYAFTWIRTDGPQEEFQQEAN